MSVKKRAGRFLKSDLALTVFLPTILISFGQGILMTTLPLYAADFTDSYSLISFVVSAAALGTLLMDVPAGAILGRLGLRTTMIGGTILVCLGTLPLAFVDDIRTAMLLRILAGIGTAFWGLSRHALIATAVPVEQRGRVLSTFGGINRMGVLLGPAAGGFIASSAGLRPSFIVAGSMSLFALFVAFRYIHDPANLQSGQKGRWSVVGRTLRTYRRDMSAAGVAQIFAQMIRTGRLLIIPLFAANELDLGIGQIGLIMSASSLAEVIMFFPAGLLMDRLGRKTASVPCFAIMGIGMAMLPFVSGFAGLLAVAMVVGIGNGLGSGSMMTLGADLAPPEATGEFLGIWRLIGDIGGFMGPIVVGVVAGLLSLNGSAWALSVVGFLAALMLALLVRETRVVAPVATGSGSTAGGD